MESTQITAKEVLGSENFVLFTLDPSATVLKTLQTLNEKNISGAPLLENKQIVGCIDAVDLLAFACSKLSSGPDTDSKHISEFAKESVKNVLNSSQRSTWKTLPESATLAEIIDVLSQPDAHRVALIDAEKNCVGLISQTQLVRFLHKNKSRFQTQMDRTISEILSGKPSRKLVTAVASDFVIEAFQKMRENHIGGVPIVNDNLQLVGHISASDIRRAHSTDLTEMRDDLSSQLKVFMNMEGSSASLPHFEPVAVHFKDSLGFVVDLLVNKGGHRAFVVDEENKPVDVLSLRDIIGQFK